MYVYTLKYYYIFFFISPFNSLTILPCVANYFFVFPHLFINPFICLLLPPFLFLFDTESQKQSPPFERGSLSEHGCFYNTENEQFHLTPLGFKRWQQNRMLFFCTMCNLEIKVFIFSYDSGRRQSVMAGTKWQQAAGAAAHHSS